MLKSPVIWYKILLKEVKDISKEELEILYYKASIIAPFLSIVITIILGVINLRYTYKTNKKQEEFKDEIQDEQNKTKLRINRIECSRDFELVNSKKESFINFITEELDDLENSENIKDENLKNRINKSNAKILRKTFNLCTSLYNELEKFCGKILDETYNCEEYINNELKKDIHFLIMQQHEFYKELYMNYKKYRVCGFIYPEFINQNNLKMFIQKYYKNDLEKFTKLRNSIMR
ncbi:MAG: hypothetical protein Q8936_01415 [Bacillota bacterium]|nr:hypothetical protein [Bacillota bacterium]